ncbi:MAG TPA: amidohydrolase family protein [Rhodothermales bacterium]|nr:amidohydrolase family protein [Rhodothermales bacterium]
MVDHHAHLLSPTLIKDWQAGGASFSRPDSFYTSPAPLLAGASSKEHGPDSLLRQAVLVPMSHLYGNRAFRQALGLSVEEEYARVRRENDYVAHEATRFPMRTRALCSVDFLRPYAWDEIQRCHDVLHSSGLKIHLASAGADLQTTTHLQELARIATWAEDKSLLLLIHLDPQQRGLEVEDVRRFIEVVLQPVPELYVCIAHLGGSGGYGPWTQAVFNTFVTWLEEETARGAPRPGVFFDISAVFLEQASEGLPATTPAEAAALRRDLRKAGLGRILFGSDYPVFDPDRYAHVLKREAQLDSAEFEQVLRNRIPPLKLPDAR